MIHIDNLLQDITNTTQCLISRGIQKDPLFINLSIDTLHPENSKREVLLGRHKRAILNQVYNLAMRYLLNTNRYKNLDIETIIQAHNILLRRINPTISGKLRTTTTQKVSIEGSIVKFLSGNEVPNRLQHLLDAYYSGELDSNKLLAIMKFKWEYVLCHPFEDGNGRTSRLLVNYLLWQANYYPILFSLRGREGYLQALRLSDEAGSSQPLVRWLLQLYLDSLLYFKSIK